MDPYPQIAGKYVIVRSTLTKELKAILQKAEDLDDLARRTESLADNWQREGREDELVGTQRKLAGIYRQYADREVATLWASLGAEPPPGLRFDLLRIVEE